MDTQLNRNMLWNWVRFPNSPAAVLVSILSVAYTTAIGAKL